MSFFNDIANLASPGPSQSNNRSADTQFKNPLPLNENFYPLQLENWYTAKPYGFKMKSRDGSEYVMFLPISPANLTISTPFATNMITTLYGTVEEHTNNRYFDISIEGTTGISPKFVEPAQVTSGGIQSAFQTLKEPGRASYPLTQPILGGFFQNTVSQAINVLNQAKKVVDAFSPKKTLETALYTDQTGYAAFHNLYRFLMQYKYDVAGVNSSTPISKHPLTFFNYKDNNAYDVAIRSFTLRRTAENPMLYYYSITMRGYNIRKCDDKLDSEDLSGRLRNLGLDGINSSGTVFTNVKNISNNAKNALGSLQNGIKIFGS